MQPLNPSIMQNTQYFIRTRKSYDDLKQVPFNLADEFNNTDLQIGYQVGYPVGYPKFKTWVPNWVIRFLIIS